MKVSLKTIKVFFVLMCLANFAHAPQDLDLSELKANLQKQELDNEMHSLQEELLSSHFGAGLIGDFLNSMTVVSDFLRNYPENTEKALYVIRSNLSLFDKLNSLYFLTQNPSERKVKKVTFNDKPIIVEIPAREIPGRFDFDTDSSAFRGAAASDYSSSQISLGDLERFIYDATSDMQDDSQMEVAARFLSLTVDMSDQEKRRILEELKRTKARNDAEFIEELSDRIEGMTEAR